MAFHKIFQNQLKNIINQVKKYSVTDLENFDGKYRHSVLTAKVNETDKSVVANNIKVKYQKEMNFSPSELQRMEPGPADDFDENQYENRKWHRMKFSSIDYGMGIDKGIIQLINNYLLKNINVSFTFLHIVNEKNLKHRLLKRKVLNRYDKFKYSFYKKVQKGFVNRAKLNKKKYLTINSNIEINKNKRIIINKINKILNI